MLRPSIIRILAMTVALSALVMALLSGCSVPGSNTNNGNPSNGNPQPGGSTSPNMPQTATALQTSFAQAEAQTEVTGGGSAFWTQTYSPPGGGTAALTLFNYGDAGTNGSTWGNGTWGTLTFTNYVDSASGAVLNGTLGVQVYQTAGTNVTSYITWGPGFAGLVDVTGNLTLSGSMSGSVTCDFLITVNGTSATYSGTLLVNGVYYDAATGQQTTAPVPTVTFNQPVMYNYAPSASSPLTMTSAGSTIYYTFDGTMPSAGSGTTTQYTGALTSQPTGFAYMFIAYAKSGGASSRVSLVVYPAY